MENQRFKAKDYCYSLNVIKYNIKSPDFFYEV